MTWMSQVPETVMHGLQITAVGMALVFFTLGLIIVSLLLLTRLPGLRSEEEPRNEAQERAVQPLSSDIVTPLLDTDEELAQVAAIAVALVRAQQRVRTPAKASVTVSAWKTAGRVHQLGL